jgi:Kef-type K+ transport system membrane component KefB
VVLWPRLARASGGGGGSDLLETVLILLGVVSVAYVVTHVATEWIANRFGIVTGVEYILIGALVGPGFGVLDGETLAGVSPALVLGTGSLGLLTGLQLNLKGGARKRDVSRALIIALVISACTLVFVGVAPFGAVYYGWSKDAAIEFAPLILCASAVALVADLAPLRSLITFLDARGEGANLALTVARASSSLAIIIFGAIFCFYHEPASELVGRDLPAAQAFGLWFGIHLVLGAVLGVIFTLFLLRDFEDEKILTVVIGMVIFTSGLAYYLKLSPIFVNFVLGVVLATISRQSEHVEQMLLSVERPLYITLFFFGGASLVFDVQWWAYLLFAGYILLRWIGRNLGGVLANRVSSKARRYPPMGAALWAPGGLSIAMLLNFNDVYGGREYTAEVYVILLMSILVSEVMAYRFARRWLIDATDVALVRDRDRAEDGSA